jgi:hypothetical protein
MKNTIAYLEIPKSPKDSILRYFVTLIVLVILSYIQNRKLYLLSNLFLAILLTLIHTDRLDYTILYSAIIGLGIFGYHNFRLYGPKISEPYKFTGYGVVISIIAGLCAHWVSVYSMEDTI